MESNPGVTWPPDCFRFNPYYSVDAGFFANGNRCSGFRPQLNGYCAFCRAFHS